MRQPPDHFEQPGASETAENGGSKGIEPHRQGVHNQTPIFRAVIGVYRRRGAGFSAQERELLLHLLRQILPDSDLAARREAARDLAGDPDADHDLVLLLAGDRIEVARPLLERSAVLTPGDLLKTVSQGTSDHLLAVAARPGLSGDVSAALAGTGNPEVIRALLDNRDAAILPPTFSSLIAAARRHAELRTPLLLRPDLPRQAAQALADLARPDAEASAAALAAKLHRAGHLRASVLVRALRDGQTALFEHAFAQMTGVEPADLRRLFRDATGFPLALAARAARMDRSAFSTVFAQYCVARGISPQMSQADIDRAMNVFRNLPQERARAELHRLARQVNGARASGEPGGARAARM